MTAPGRCMKTPPAATSTRPSSATPHCAAPACAPTSEPLVRAREWILANGGLKNIRNFTRYWLALIGEWPWAYTPTLPPELILLPSWVPFNIYQFASWARGTMVPLCVLSARRPVRRLPPDSRLDELFPEGREKFDFSLQRTKSWVSWEGIFLGPGPAAGGLRPHEAAAGPASGHQASASSGSSSGRKPTAPGAAFSRPGSTL